MTIQSNRGVSRPIEVPEAEDARAEVLRKSRQRFFVRRLFDTTFFRTAPFCTYSLETGFPRLVLTEATKENGAPDHPALPSFCSDTGDSCGAN